LCTMIRLHCTSCGKLLGELRDGVLHIEHGRLQVEIRGSLVRRRCERCKCWNVLCVDVRNGKVDEKTTSLA